eukprot:223395-Rhodomonas_salina.3
MIPHSRDCALKSVHALRLTRLGCGWREQERVVHLEVVSFATALGAATLAVRTPPLSALSSPVHLTSHDADGFA